MNICMIGTGYVGLVTGACFAELGNNVICVDSNEEKINQIKSGILPIFEPGLKEMVYNNTNQKRLSFTTDLSEGVNKSTICFIAVGTPQDVDGSADLKYVLQVAEDIGKVMMDEKIVVTKSTVPVGTSEKVRDAIERRLLGRADIKKPFVHVVSNPEFLKEGNAIQDFMKPDRVVIGTSEPKIAEIFQELYEPFMKTTGNPILIMDNVSAEMTKYAANSFLATKISFINEISILCEKVGADVSLVREGIGTDERIGHRFLLPGPGYGGSCFPKDVQALIRTARDSGMTLQVCEAAQKANIFQKKYITSKILKSVGAIRKKNKNYYDTSVAVWGLTFKPKTDDIRESPALTIIDFMLRDFITVKVYDPLGMDNVSKVFGNRVMYCKDNYEALEGVDALVILTDWNQFKSPDFERMKSLMRNKVIFDCRNILNREDVRAQGFTYHGIGRP